MSRALPWLALAITLTIWAGYLVSTRAVMTGTLSPVDLGLLRSVPAALLLLPLTLRKGLFPGGANWKDVACIALLGGTAFTLLLPAGLHYAPVADSGIFTPSMFPAFVAILAASFIGARYRRIQLLGFALILTGALSVGGFNVVQNAASGAWRGHILFLLASLSWASYTVRFRVNGLSALDASILLLTWTAMIFVVLALVFGTHLGDLSTPMLIFQTAMGIAAGLVANFTFLVAIRALGHEIPAASAALVPVLAALGGWVFLGEPIGTAKAIGIAVSASGVLLASGLVKRQRVAQN